MGRDQKARSNYVEKNITKKEDELEKARKRMRLLERELEKDS